MLTFCLYELAMNLDVQNKLRAELLAAYNEHNRTININMLNGLKYLDAVLSGKLHHLLNFVIQKRSLQF